MTLRAGKSFRDREVARFSGRLQAGGGGGLLQTTAAVILTVL